MNNEYKKWLWKVEDILRDEHDQMLTSDSVVKKCFKRGLSPSQAAKEVLKGDDDATD